MRGESLRPGARLAVLALLGTVLAGCVDEAPSGTLTNASGEGSDTTPLALPDNRSGTFNAFQETNRTEEGSGGVDHHHDYWLGRDRVEIFRARHAMSVQPNQDGAAAVITMPLGALVFEGTAKIEFTVANPERHVCDPTGFRWNAKHTCTDDSGFDALPRLPRVQDPAPPALRLQYITSADGGNEWRDAGALTWGVPLEIPVKPVETDMPHSTTSLWRFRVESSQPMTDSTLTFEAAATLVRGEDVPLWPGHPDFYADRSWRVVYDDTSGTRERGFFGDVFGYNSSLQQAKPGRLVSYGTRTLHVWINVTKLDAPPEQGPTNWYLYFHNATGDWWSTNLFDPNMTIDKRELKFTLKVDDSGMDSPYAPESRWQFLLRGTKDYEAFTCYGGCASYVAEYHMTILATNEEMPDDAYTPVNDA